MKHIKNRSDQAVMKPNLGAKRHCPACGAPFYDLGRNPAACPKCGTMHDINAPVRRRGRGKPALKVVKPVVETRKPKPKPKPVKEIEDVNLDEFEDIEPLDTDGDIEEIEEVEDIEPLEELETEGAGSGEKAADDAVIEDEAIVGAV